MSDSKTPTGPVEAGKWPDRLMARALSPSDPPRLWGYDVHQDLARHYRFSEVLWLAATGEVPEAARQAEVLECVLIFLAPVTVAEAPAHAATIANLCKSSLASVVSVGALTLAQQGQWVLNHHAELWPWGEAPQFPAALRGAPEDGPAVARLEAALARLGRESRIFRESPALVTAGLAVLFELGFTEPRQLLSLWMSCKLPCVLAEAFAAPAGRLNEYPLDLPRFEYEAPDEQ